VVLFHVVVPMMGGTRSGSGFEDLGGVPPFAVGHYGYGDPCVRRHSKDSRWVMTDIPSVTCLCLIYGCCELECGWLRWRRAVVLCWEVPIRCEAETTRSLRSWWLRPHIPTRGEEVRDDVSSSRGSARDSRQPTPDLLVRWGGAGNSSNDRRVLEGTCPGCGS